MKLIIVASFTIVATAGALATPMSVATWARPLSATPEGLLIGATLLSVAALLRYRFSREPRINK